MVSALDSGSKGPGSSLGWGHCVVFLGKTLYSTVPLSTQEYKWAPANCQGNLTKCWGGNLRWTIASHPGGVAILLVASWYENRDKLRQLWAAMLLRLNLPTRNPQLRCLLIV